MKGLASEGLKRDIQPRISPTAGAMDRLARLLRVALTNRPIHIHANSGSKGHSLFTHERMKNIHAAPVAR